MDALQGRASTLKRDFSIQRSYPYIVVPKERRFIRWTIFVAAGILLGVGILAAIVVPYVHILRKTAGTYSIFYISPTLRECESLPREQLLNCVTQKNGVLLHFYVAGFDEDASQLNVRVSPEPTKLVANEVGQTRLNLTFFVADSVNEFKVNTKLSPFTVKVSAEVDMSYYPFETYALEQSYTYITDGAANDIPFIAIEDTEGVKMPSYTVERMTATGSTMEDGTEYDAMYFYIGMRRDAITRLIVVATWALFHLFAIMWLGMTLQAVFRGRDSFSILNWIASGIISAGTIRKLQPLAPSIGTIADVVTYIWAVIVATVSSFIFFCVVFRSYKPESPRDKELKARDKERRWRKLLADEAAAAREDEAAAKSGRVNAFGGTVVGMNGNRDGLWLVASANNASGGGGGGAGAE
ncbi:hypothetical protein HDU96_004517 [Phlyctochytrium bullatum]|nr:hypothetical protein HDU96_004517 [Phlyctochytrium bullatum]